MNGINEHCLERKTNQILLYTSRSKKPVSVSFDRKSIAPPPNKSDKMMCKSMLWSMMAFLCLATVFSKQSSDKSSSDSSESSEEKRPVAVANVTEVSVVSEIPASTPQAPSAAITATEQALQENNQTQLLNEA
ncbi:Hypothetical predicted protein [Cloeon dipterum]|uniref:Uncharacterized protein n=1 Tax=Cloeon dipterum TaxID=197152 RepID=A0A8S1DHD3_9INSE|nr:Hypothetical predicted protein [Cloeon dipterum]